MINDDYIKRVKALDLEDEAKDGYLWLLSNFDAVERIIEKNKDEGMTVGEFREKLWREIGFKPALLFSFQDCYKSEKVFIEKLEEQFG